jgi:hypothetical protein
MEVKNGKYDLAISATLLGAGIALLVAPQEYFQKRGYEHEDCCGHFRLAR